VVQNDLPIDPYLPRILQDLGKHRALVLVAEPGAGKTTRVPPAILKSGLLSSVHPDIWMLQPRRLAARTAAERIADENGWSVGNEVGYQVRFESRFGPQTRLRILTEAILNRHMIDDPSLDRVGCVILDEFHERSIHSDLAIALLREIKQSLREDLLIVVMSATLDTEPVSQFLFDAPILRVPGQMYPVDIRYCPIRYPDMAEGISDLVHDEPVDGHTLVFLPGVAEIQQVQNALIRQSPDLSVFALYGSLAFDKQQKAVEKSDRPRIILSTNLAETSLTIEGVRRVIDSGWVRQNWFDPERGLDTLRLQRVSQASARQRAGRAGRTAPGVCVRLWNESEHQRLEALNIPEVQRVDLSSTVLDLHAWGQTDSRSFAWYEPPSQGSLDYAERLLRMLGALDETGRLTDTGRRIRTLPLHPRLGRLLTEARGNRMACSVAAIISEKDFVCRTDREGPAPDSTRLLSDSDVGWRLDWIEEWEKNDRTSDSTRRAVDISALRQVIRVRDQLIRLFGPESTDTKDHGSSLSVQKLVLLAYPDRVCRRRSDPRTGTMVGGSGVRLSPDCSVLQGDFFVAVDARQDDRSRNREAWVRIASRIEPEWLQELFPQSIVQQRELQYDADRDRVVSQVRVKYQDLVIRETTAPEVDPQEAETFLVEELSETWDQVLQSHPALNGLTNRIRFLAYHLPNQGFPTLNKPMVRELLQEAAWGQVSKRSVVERLVEVLRSRLVYPLDRILEQEAPETLCVPSGSRIKLQYFPDPSHPPVLAVRMQELFGLEKTPCLASGRVNVLLHLLGPNFRPVQVTQDLESFWSNTYPQVRKELRAQYPKHSWPEDPRRAEAVRGIKRR
jgi:ATP-dependent helicase HrpB